MAEEAENLLLTSGVRRKSLDAETDREQLKATLQYIRAVQNEALTGDFTSITESREKVMVDSYDALPPSEREPAFKCVTSYKACKSDAKTIEDKVLCGLALAICFAKEVVPLA